MTRHDAALRRDIALANRILERTGLAGAFGHASARLAAPGQFLIPTRRSPDLADGTGAHGAARWTSPS